MNELTEIARILRGNGDLTRTERDVTAEFIERESTRLSKVGRKRKYADSKAKYLARREREKSRS